MCKISCENSKWLLRKWQTTLGDTFFAAHCRVAVVHAVSHSAADSMLNESDLVYCYDCRQARKLVYQMVRSSHFSNK